MLTILFCVVLGWGAIKVIIEIVRLSWGLLLFVGGLLFVPIVVVGALAGEVLVVL